MLDLKYKIGDVLEDNTGQLWVIVYYDEETKLYNIQRVEIRQITEYKLNNEYRLVDEKELSDVQN